MENRVVSQRSLVVLKRLLQEMTYHGNFDIYESLYENDFPDWFVNQARERHEWEWIAILMDLRRGTFFLNRDHHGRARCITDASVESMDDLKQLGEAYSQRLAAFVVATLETSQFRFRGPDRDALVRALQLDGFDVDKKNMRLIPLEGPVSVQEEEDRLSRLLSNSGLPQRDVLQKHMEDAPSHYADGKDHSSLGEARSLVQGLIDGICEETNGHGGHRTKLAGGTSNRIKYLKDVGFLTSDEEAAFNSGWGTLSAGAHPGVPDRDQARIGLILALEFAQLLLIKFQNWQANSYKCFS